MDRHISSQRDPVWVLKMLNLLHLLCDYRWMYLVIIQIIIYKFCYKNARILDGKGPCVLLLVVKQGNRQRKFLTMLRPRVAVGQTDQQKALWLAQPAVNHARSLQACGSCEHIILPWSDQTEGEISPDITAQTHHACEFLHVRSRGSCRRSTAVFHLVFITHKSAACGIVSGLGIGSQSRACC